jgi:hypothetical protein
MMGQYHSEIPGLQQDLSSGKVATNAFVFILLATVHKDVYVYMLSKKEG